MGLSLSIGDASALRLQIDAPVLPPDLFEAAPPVLNAPLKRRGHPWTTLVAGSSIRLTPGLWLKVGTLTRGSRFFAAPPQSSAALRMGAFRPPPRGGLTLIF